ncbi:MAG: aminotransferase class I/II-fold pyridoxal phosphate-dependent enzyme [Rhodopseudomonas palustris]|nr:aminotransferase class I/II-fold pyridoxal phosphate-dependent enzyme [Rhodopseudomonas palustris]
MAVEELLALEPGSGDGLRTELAGLPPNTLGDPGLRGEIAGRYETVEPGQVIVFTGAEEPIYAFMNAVLEPGDHLVVHYLAYQSHYSLAESRGIAVFALGGQSPRTAGRRIPGSCAPALLRPETKAILVSTPHNPTGFHFDELRPCGRCSSPIARASAASCCSRGEVYRGTRARPGGPPAGDVADLCEAGRVAELPEQELRAGGTAPRLDRDEGLPDLLRHGGVPGTT